MQASNKALTPGRIAYPLPALREALLNAVVHRDYTDGSDVQVDNYRSSLRNKLIAEGIYLTHAIEKYGSGFIRIRKALLAYPEVEFTVEEKFGGVMASFTQSANQFNTAGGGVTEGVTGLLSLIIAQPGLRGLALATLLGTSPKNVERWLKQLKTAGQIQFTGSPKTGGYFLLEQKQ